VNAQRDFATVGDKDFFEQGSPAYSMMIKGSPNSTG